MKSQSNDKNIIPDQSALSSLQQSLKMFQAQIARQHKLRQQKIQKRTQQLQQLQQDYEERINLMISKVQQLRRKQTLLITLRKFQPDLPQDFPKNYYCQLVYQDTILTGSQKFTDFDQNVVQQKFVVPLLFATSLKVQIWSAQQQPILWKKSQIDLQKDIQTAVVNTICEGKLSFGNINLTYILQLQGIGFSTWLKNIAAIRELQSEKIYSRQQGNQKKNEMKAKVLQKRQKFNQKFQRKITNTTSQYNVNQLDKILQQLKLD